MIYRYIATHLAKAVLFAAASAFFGLSAHADAVSHLLFELKPLAYIEKNELKGPVAIRTQTVFSDAGLDTNLIKDLPVRRILTLLKEPVPNRCSAGWFKTAERLANYRYSDAIYVDSPQFILATKKREAELAQHKTLAALFSDQNLTLGAINGLSYGRYFDDLITNKNTKRYLVQNYEQVFMMLASGRVDYVIVDKLDVVSLPSQGNLKPEDFTEIHFKEAPKGERRYIICSQATDDSFMQKLNASIKNGIKDL